MATPTPSHGCRVSTVPRHRATPYHRDVTRPSCSLQTWRRPGDPVASTASPPHPLHADYDVILFSSPCLHTSAPLEPDTVSMLGAPLGTHEHVTARPRRFREPSPCHRAAPALGHLCHVARIQCWQQHLRPLLARNSVKPLNQRHGNHDRGVELLHRCCRLHQAAAADLIWRFILMIL